ncbi:MAG: YgiT-type zinc finger protein [Acidobacteria bacterium]|nr:YgiT-type zinc finger protein [Acidobacteriota bacterium]
MKCGVCGAELKPVDTDLPFKVSDRTIVILKSLPVLQCPNCAAYVIEDEVFRRVEEILDGVDGAAELEVIRFAA